MSKINTKVATWNTEDGRAIVATDTKVEISENGKMIAILDHFSNHGEALEWCEERFGQPYFPNECGMSAYGY